MKLRFIWIPLLFATSMFAQSVDLQVELMNRIGTDISRKGDFISARVVAPAQFKNDMVEGKITESKSGAKQGGTSVLNFSFTTLRHGDSTIAIKSQLKSVANSKGRTDVDESGRMVRRNSNSQSGRSVKSAAVGSRLGGILGGGKGASIGSLADTTAGALVDVSSDSPNINFDPGSRFVLESTSDNGPSLASMESSQQAPKTSARVAQPPQSSSTYQSSYDNSTASSSESQPQFSTLKATFIPGEKTIFYDDFSDMGPDDAPAHFKTRGPSVELRSNGKARQLTVVGRYTGLSPNLTSLPANFTFEADIVTDRDNPGGRAITSLVLFSKKAEVFILDTNITGTLWDFVASMRKPYSELGRKRITTSSGNGKLDMWVQNGRLRVFYNGEKVLDFNQVNLPPIDSVELRHDFYGAKAIGYRMVRFAESTPDFSQVIGSSGRYVTHGILFDTGSDRIKPESAPVIQSIARGLESNPNLKLLIEGHTDSVGNAASNLDLSKRRAEAVKSVLVSQFNIEADRLSTQGMGATKPMDTNDTPQGRAQNRRVELVKK